MRYFINNAKAYEPEDDSTDYADLADEAYDWQEDPAVDYRVTDDIAEA